MKALCSCMHVTANKASDSLALVLTVRPVPRFVPARTVSMWICRSQSGAASRSPAGPRGRALKRAQLREGIGPEIGHVARRRTVPDLGVF